MSNQLNQTMQAVGVRQALSIDHPDSLIDIVLPRPTPQAHELLVQVEAIAVNPADYRIRQRKVNDGTTSILGWDSAGIVAQVGKNVTGFNVGDKVYYAGDVNKPGSNSQWHCIDAELVGHRPQSITAQEAAALPLCAVTAWEILFERIGFSLTAPNRWRNLLIIGGAGGVGSMAIQLAKLIPDLHIIATASRQETQDWCRQCGADLIIDHRKDIPTQLKEAGIKSIDAALLLNSPDSYLPILAELLTPQGSIGSIVPFNAPVDMNLLMRKSIRFVWEYMFTRSSFSCPDKKEQQIILNKVSELVDAGHIKSIMQQHLSPINASNLRYAHAQLESGRVIGKISLSSF